MHVLADCYPWKGLSIYSLANYTQRFWKLQPIKKVLLRSVLVTDFHATLALAQ